MIITPESKFKQKVTKYLDSIGAYHVAYFPSIYTPSGVPDRLICYKGRFIGLELKAEKGKPSELQLYHLEEINKAGGLGILLYPKDFEEFKKTMEAL